MLLAFHITVATAEMHHLLPHFTDIHCLVSINVQQALMNVSCYSFSTWRNSMPHFCFICTSMSDTTLSHCPSAAICHTATKCNGILVRRFNLYCHIMTSASDTMGQHHKIGGVTFRVAFIYDFKVLPTHVIL